MTSPNPIAAARFRTVSDLVREHARAQPDNPALQDETQSLSYAQLDALVDRIAASLQRDGIRHGDVVAICGLNSARHAAVFLGVLRAGAAVAPLAPSSTSETLASMLRDCGASLWFADAAADVSALDSSLPCVSLDGVAPGKTFEPWLAEPGSVPQPVDVTPDDAFNIIYSSGTTGTPKGIVQSHAMRWAHIQRGAANDYGPQSVTLLATPLYSNTTLVIFVPSLAYGGSVLLMRKFDAARYLKLAEQHRVTHAILVPVQYQRIMALADFDAHDLSSFQYKFSTSAPFRAELKADVLARWPGRLIEYYGMTEGGGTCILDAHLHSDKLHTVGRPAANSDVRLIDESGNEVAAGEIGEVVGHSTGMMKGYHGHPEKTREAEWFDREGKRFIRTGDVGRFDEDGFLTLLDRRKDMIISGGFNIYPSDLEAQLRAHPAVEDVAVVGVASEQWGETPVAFVVQRRGTPETANELKDWFNQRAGKTQRLADLILVNELPRSAIGKVLKRELRDGYASLPPASSSSSPRPRI
ncbi:class I adenylate-forming enzyme family protein [Diaphorobacter aerolatus]|uniref:Acyl--CoA ligase n=1 Tax=Diaphorobacter aerolatus TaxID=1288495 RepID=A0A7H0GHE6_9BURK|nr:class I adenylate-forming enzyme family protein [Diaphorobacter aerolatus]QNP47712.1 acyl--CoA ligase [Diaphorobacter aerolatus]